jgi:hypothetical protein
MRLLLTAVLFLGMGAAQERETSQREVFDIYVRPQLESAAKTVCECPSCLSAAECDRLKKACRETVLNGKCPVFSTYDGQCRKSGRDEKQARSCQDLVKQALDVKTKPEELSTPKPALPSPGRDPGEHGRASGDAGAITAILQEQYSRMYRERSSQLAGQSATVEFTARFRDGKLDTVQVDPGKIQGGSAEYRAFVAEVVRSLTNRKDEIRGGANGPVTVQWKFSSSAR